MLILLLTLLATDGSAATPVQNCTQNKGASADASVDEFCQEVKTIVATGTECKHKILAQAIRSTHVASSLNEGRIKNCETGISCSRKDLWALVERINFDTALNGNPIYKGHAEKSFEKCKGASVCELREVMNSLFRAHTLALGDDEVKKPDLSSVKSTDAILSAAAPVAFNLLRNLLIDSDLDEKLAKQFAECK